MHGLWSSHSMHSLTLQIYPYFVHSLMVQLKLLSPLGNKVSFWLVENRSRDVKIKTHEPWLHSMEGNMSFVYWCTLLWSFPPLVDFQRFIQNSHRFEGTVKNRFLFEQLFACLKKYAYFVIIMFEDDNRTLRRGIIMLPRFKTKQLMHAVKGVHGFRTTSEGNGTISPLECTK